ncbi:MAG: hypothetical protein JNM09_00450 [Blastocatellia bacterium]|nr:hypothetical protein [Blastocatellia bacterium]
MPDTRPPSFAIYQNADGTHFLNVYWQDASHTTRRETIADGITFEAATNLKTALEAVADKLCFSLWE